MVPVLLVAPLTLLSRTPTSPLALPLKPPSLLELPAPLHVTKVSQDPSKPLAPKGLGPPQVLVKLSAPLLLILLILLTPTSPLALSPSIPETTAPLHVTKVSQEASLPLAPTVLGPAQALALLLATLLLFLLTPMSLLAIPLPLLELPVPLSVTTVSQEPPTLPATTVHGTTQALALPIAPLLLFLLTPMSPLATSLPLLELTAPLRVMKVSQELPMPPVTTVNGPTQALVLPLLLLLLSKSLVPLPEVATISEIPLFLP